jgi:hypothetical protein
VKSGNNTAIDCIKIPSATHAKLGEPFGKLL